MDDGVRLASALRREGKAYDGLARMVKAGELVKVRHGRTPANSLKTP